MIDFVLLWVDGNDAQWLKKKNLYCNKPSEKEQDMRFRDMDTLKYVLRSIDKHAPWYNKIHVITEGHYPKWLDIKHPKINLITHEELYYKTTHLPVFNSSSLEMNLPNLKGVTNKIVYLNDDMIILKPVGKSRFFKKNRPVDYLPHGWISRNWLYGKVRNRNEWVRSLNNNLKLVNNFFSPIKLSPIHSYDNTYSFNNKCSNFLLNHFYKKFIWIQHWHHPQPYLMSTLEEVYSKCEKEMMVCSKNKFRTNSDLTQYLYRYWHLAKQDFFPRRYNDGFVSRITKFDDLVKDIELLSGDERYNFVCFNDNMATVKDKEFQKTKLLAISFLEKIFPEKSIFEI